MPTKISVVMPSLNAGQTIANSIKSIIDQTFKEWELIIIDDGSTDNTEEVVKKFKDPRIKYIKIEHKGIAYARNMGSKIAKSPYIAVQDADDLSMPDRLEKLYPLIKKYDVVFHGMYVNFWDNQYQCITREYRQAEEVNIKKLLTCQYMPGVPIYRKSIWQKKPYREETRYAHDYMMHLDWILSGFRYYALNEGLYEYVRHANSASVRFEREGKRAESIKNIKKIIKDEYAKNLRYHAGI